MLTYMSGHRSHERDGLEFLLHDMQHMEHFRNDKQLYHEQVGFFASIELLGREKGVKYFFTSSLGYDKQLWLELEYVISDMNTYVTHLMSYILAKMLFATERLCAMEKSTEETTWKEGEGKRDCVENILLTNWTSLLVGLGVGPGSDEWFSCKRMIDTCFQRGPTMSEEEGDTIRRYFRRKGEEVLQHAI
jgi:hypothetical protein